MTLGRAQLSDPRPLRRSSTQPPSRRSIDQSLTRTPDIGRKPLPTISSQPGLPHTPSRVRVRTAINAPPPWSQPNVSVKHERAGSPAVRIAFMRRPVTAPAAPLPSRGAFRPVLTEQQKWRFKPGAQSLMHEFPLLSDALASKAAGCRAKHLLRQGYDVSTLRQAGYSAEELKNEVFPPPPSHVLCLVYHQRLHHCIIIITACALSLQDFTAEELRSAGYTLSELRWAFAGGGGLHQLVLAGYSTTELREVRCSARKLCPHAHVAQCPRFARVVRWGFPSVYSKGKGTQLNSCARAAST